jgi:hypothetical protein
MKRKYELRKREDGMEAIFDTETEERISDWYHLISTNGLVNGKSDYYLAYDDISEKYAIFHKDGRRISKWFDLIYTDGLVEGESEYYIAGSDDWEAIFHLDGRQISDWFEYIDKDGLVKGGRNLYIAGDKKYAIFDENGNMITPERFIGIMLAPSFFSKDSKEEYYIGIGEKKWAIYHISGEKVSKDFSNKDLRKVEEIRFDNINGILELLDENGSLIKEVKFDPVFRFKEEIIDYTKLLNI